MLARKRQGRPVKATCGSGGHRIFLYGDSWAADDGVAPALAETFGAIVGVIAYGGATSQRLSEWMDIGSATDLLGGRPDHVVIIAGVNDSVLHIGGDVYARSIEEMADTWKMEGAQVSILGVPHVGPSRLPLNKPWGVIANFRRLVRDRGQINVIRKYRQHLAKRGIDAIDYDEFLPEYDPASYVNPTHLTKAEYRRLGRFIGEKLAVSA